MQKLGLNEIREKYLSFFESKNHLRLSSFSLVPVNDASLLLINSGMAPLKPYFTGKEEPPRKRVTTCQKCIRTPDIENVGKTARHGTFFEMLGNFSFGDYFKKEATSWAWEFITKELKLPLDKLWISIYERDEDAFKIWTEYVGVPKERIVRMGKDDNFWEIGTGPCGPCSEIYFDLGEHRGCGKEDCKVGCDCDRYIEFWNLVFTQFNKTDDGEYLNLAHPNIDTGMGLERLACIMQDVNNLFEVDTIRRVLDYVCNLANVEYGVNAKTDISIRVITDHIRSTTMLISDGVVPSNEGRGYVLRRLLRRAARHGKLLGINRTFLYDVANVVINESKDAYPQLEEKQDYIRKVIKIEEEKFQSTIDQGLSILNQFIEELKLKNKNILDGEKVFKLHDTYGFPIDLTREILNENKMELDEDGFKIEMEKQKKKARDGAKNKENVAWSEDLFSQLDKSIKTEFTGYKNLEDEAKIIYIFKENEIVDSAKSGDNVSIITDRTPFYAESGGQISDQGYINAYNMNFKVENMRKTPDGKYIHIGKIVQGEIKIGDNVRLLVDIERRKNIARNHTTTHLIHRALKNVLGEHVNQAGSLVTNERFRFDFSHFKGLTDDELKRVEMEVNTKILENLSVEVREMDIEQAKKSGAMALFGEKYGKVVRVVSIGDYSTELCGGTHLKSTAEAGLVKLIGESGVAAGIRRIEGMTGISAINYYHEKENQLNMIANILKTTVNDSLKKAESVIEEVKDYQKEINELKTKLASSSIDDILKTAVNIKGINIVTAKIEKVDLDSLRNIADMIKNKLGTVVVVLATQEDKKANIIVTATKDVVAKGIHSGNIVKQVAKLAGGGGGGRPDMAQAGCRDISKIDDALKAAINIIEEQIK